LRALLRSPKNLSREQAGRGISEARLDAAGAAGKGGPMPRIALARKRNRPIAICSALIVRPVVGGGLMLSGLGRPNLTAP
jgi:hypothetical protein